MHLQKLFVENYKALKNVWVEFSPDSNIIVGDNEKGKSTVLEAINIALCGLLDGRFIQYELHPLLFNMDAVAEYIDRLKSGEAIQPPKILIELYLNEDESFAKLKGTNNSLRENCPGISLSIEFDESFVDEYSEYIKNPENIKNLPIEYYTTNWLSFANEKITSRSIPINTTLIDTSIIRTTNRADKYILKIIDDVLDKKQKVDLSLSYRKMKDQFMDDKTVKDINLYLKDKKGDISSKDLTISLDTTSKSSWQGGITAHLDDIPLSLVGKGEQSSVKIKLAMESASDAHVFLIEEPENHLSYTNLNNLLKKLSSKSNGRQLIITTHNSFVLNKLGVENVILFNKDKSATLASLPPDTYDYFMKLPGHDTLRLILAKKAILVEGPSDELIVQKSFIKKYGCMPLEKNTDVISVKSLAFKRFLDIAVLLDIDVCVVTDNDGDVQRLKDKYKDYDGKENIRICYDEDTEYPTLEPQMVKCNTLSTLNGVLGKSFEDEDSLLNYMKNNKTECALKIFNSEADINFPKYIENAIEQ